MILAGNKTYEMWADCQPELFDPKSSKIPEMHVITSSLKGLHTWATMKGL